MTELLSVRLQKAHDYLAAHKWTRGTYARGPEGNNIIGVKNVTDDCAVCGMGAYYVANGAGLGTYVPDVQDALDEAAGRHFPHFNDHKAHDKRDVLRKFRIAIRAAKKLGN